MARRNAKHFEPERGTAPPEFRPECEMRPAFGIRIRIRRVGRKEGYAAGREAEYAKKREKRYFIGQAENRLYAEKFFKLPMKALTRLAFWGT